MRYKVEIREKRRGKVEKKGNHLYDYCFTEEGRRRKEKKKRKSISTEIFLDKNQVQ